MPDALAGLSRCSRQSLWIEKGLARNIHDGSLRTRAVALRDRHVEPRDPEAYLNNTARERAASLPPNARRSSEFAIAAEALMNNAGEIVLW